MDKVLISFSVVTVLICSCMTAIPPQIKPCPRSSSNFAQCVKQSLESLRPLLKTGNISPNLKIEGLDPLLIGDVVINNGIDLKLFGTQVFGVSDFTVEKIRVDPVNIKVDLVLRVPKMTTKSSYNLKWALGIINIDGKGTSYSQIENAIILVKLSGREYFRNGVKYIRIDDAKLQLKLSNLRIHFNNLFNGNKALENLGNEVINQNIQQFQGFVIPQIEKGIERKILKVANQVFEIAPAKDFFLEH